MPDLLTIFVSLLSVFTPRFVSLVHHPSLSTLCKKFLIRDWILCFIEFYGLDSKEQSRLSLFSKEQISRSLLFFQPLSAFLSLTPSRRSCCLIHSIMHYARIGKTLILLIRARTAVNYSDCKFNALFTRASYYVPFIFHARK